jgi:long-chain-fatty-acid--CoA ligase ACSBG
MDTYGFFKITGRIKELIITEGGKNIAPIPIESRIKENLSSVISQAIVIGDEQKFLTCLLTLKVKIDPATSIPSEILEQSVKNWCKKILKNKGIQEEGMIPNTISDFKNNRHADTFLQGIQEGFDQANIKADFRAAEVKRFCILPNEFSIAGGEFGPTLKIKRHIIAKKYQKEICCMYLE